MTAAHCATALRAGATIVYGATDLTTPGLSVSASVAGSIVHPDYNAADDSSRANDVSVMILASAFSGVEPARVEAAQPVDSLAAEFGWDNESPLLRIALVNVVSAAACIQEFGVFPRDGVCMQRVGADKICQGDSGSPSAWIGAFGNTGKIAVRGILALPSWGASCERTSDLSVFANLSYHAEWLDLATLASETCGGNSTCIGRITDGAVIESLPLDNAATVRPDTPQGVGTTSRTYTAHATGCRERGHAIQAAFRTSFGSSGFECSKH